jgi:hypothetical protein
MRKRWSRRVKLRGKKFRLRGRRALWPFQRWRLIFGFLLHFQFSRQPLDQLRLGDLLLEVGLRPQSQAMIACNASTIVTGRDANGRLA